MREVERAVDFHSHILPGADHGSKSVEISKKQLELAVQAGVKYIVATSHFYPNKDSVDEFIERREKSYQQLVDACSGTLSPRVILGAEILLCRDIDRLPGIEKLTVNGTKILFVELPKTEEYDTLVDIVRELIASGYEILLAHAERYPYDIVKRLVEVGVRLQVNASVFDGLFLCKKVRKYLKNGWVNAIGSDIHGANGKAYRSFLKATSRIPAPIWDFSESLS